MPHFHLTDTPLERGTTLIEASAGTGKTFTIAVLFLRLLLEQRLTVREILVVTYTEAATEELRGRIRDTLAGALRAFTTGESSTPHLQALLAQPAARRDDAVRDLELALAGFDEAPIFTIHGFSQRMLRDRAFESGALFDVELVTDQSALLGELADDFWRRQFYNASAVLVNFALGPKALRAGPAELLPLFQSSLNHPFLRLLPPESVAGRGVEELGAALEASFAAARAVWLAERDAIQALFSGARWGNKPYSMAAEMAEHFARLENCFSAEARPESLASLAAFTQSAISSEENRFKKSKVPAPTHPFFRLCDQVLAHASAFVAGLRVGFFHFARTELPRRKAEAKVQSFDDLLTRLHAALAAPSGDALAAAIRARYPAALIDEFQDTDPVQFQSFTRIFQAAPEFHRQERQGAPRGNWLFLIGDPKQAIYGFRGADIFTYLAAADAVGRRYTLGANWRSESGLVAAVNAVFGHSPRPFVFPQIAFEKVAARGAADQRPLTIDRRGEPALQLWFHPRDDQAKPIAVGHARPRLARCVATEIVRLLNGEVRIGERRLRPGDIAVLVLTHKQAELVQRELAARGVPSVQHSTGNVFASPEARELARVLAGLAQPGREPLLRGALATDFLGVTAAQLDGFRQRADEWQAWLQRAHEYRAEWLDAGFIVMFRHLLQREQVRPRLLAFPDGERRLTNVLHLAELLHQAATERRLGPGALLQWLATQMQPDELGTQPADAHQLRLERDEHAVKLVTVHKSKGLQYPVVFCPFSWGGSELRPGNKGEECVLFHERGGEGRLTRDLGSADWEAHRFLALEEKRAETLRLFYVALTRAEHRCYVAWGWFGGAESSAPAWLLHPSSAAAGVTDAQLLGDLETLAASEPAIAVSTLPEPDEERFAPEAGAAVELRARAFPGRVRHDWQLVSFSSLTASAPAELPDHDNAIAPVVAAPEVVATGIFAFPRGRQPGTCLHKIFEELDFTQRDDAALASLVRERLIGHGLDAAKYTACVCEAVRRTLAVPLGGSMETAPMNLVPEHPSPALRAPSPLVGRGERDGVRGVGFGSATHAANVGDSWSLSHVTASQRLTELEFGFPLRTLSSAALGDCFERHGDGAVLGDFPARLRRLGFEQVRGHLKGFVDLVFEHDGRYYLADWKSNHLGNRAEDYTPDALGSEMRHQLYLLQYHLYTVALHRYLALRLPGYDYERHFGGVFYVFVRGVDPARPELGIFRDRPPVALIAALDVLLVEAPEVAR